MIRGVSENHAVALLKNVKPDQPVEEQLKWADQLIARSRGRIYNPAGFYVYVVKEDIRPPFLLSGDATAPEGEQPETNSAPPEQKLVDREAYERFCDAEIAKNLGKEAPEALERLLEAKKKEILAQFPSARHWTAQDQLQLAQAAVRGDLSRKFSLPTLEDFVSGRYRE